MSEEQPRRLLLGRLSLGRLPWGRLLRVSFVIAAVVLGGLAVADQWNQVRGSLARLGGVSLTGALLAVLAGQMGSMLVWRSLLADAGSPLRVPDAGRVFFVGQLGKYLPGSVWPVLAQMELGRAHGVPRRRSGAVFLLTVLVVLAAGLLTAAVTLPFLAGAVARGYVFALAVAPVLLAGLHPRVLNPVLGWLLRRTGRGPLEHPLSVPAVGAALGWAVAAWLAYGIQVAVLAAPLATGVFSAGGQVAGGLVNGLGLVSLATGAFALAWCAGFLVVLVPAGAGVREVALVAALSPVLDRGSALAVALASRLLMTLGDLVCAGLAGWTSRRRFPHSSAG